jgi:hypothetical protein
MGRHADLLADLKAAMAQAGFNAGFKYVRACAMGNCRCGALYELLRVLFKRPLGA